MPVDDSYTKALLHFNGADNSTTFTDESGKSWSRTGTPVIDTAQYKFGGSSCYFDGNGDYLTTADSADWQLDGGSNSNEWTIDLWIRQLGVAIGSTHIPLVQQWQSDNENWAFRWQGSDQFNIQVITGGTNIVNLSFAATIATYDGVWAHVALVKQGTTGYKCFLNGNQVGTTQTDTSTFPNYTGSLYLGYLNLTAGNSYLEGWLDEVRISKGIARWTANFTPPTREYGFRGPKFRTVISQQ